MGCGASSENNAHIKEADSNLVNDSNHSNVVAQNGRVKSPPDNNNKQANNSSSHSAPSKSVAFEVELSPEQSVPHKKPPKRIQKLAPLKNAPSLTAEQLEEKIRHAEEKRNKALEKKKKVASRSSLLRKQLLEAKEFGQKQEIEQQKKEITEKQMSADRNREAKMKALEEKRRKREERAQKAKERLAAQKRIENGEELDFEVEKDDDYNADDMDSWLDGENNERTLESEDTSERIYSGRESPHKTIVVRTSAETRARMSAFSTSTADSFDYAFQRKPLAPIEVSKRDDFFDS